MANHEEAQILVQLDQISPIQLTADIVCSFVASNSVPVAALADLLRSVHSAVIGLGKPSVAVAEQVAQATPAQIKKSVTDEALISFEDGRPYKTLRRHLTGRGLTAEAYRAKYGLPTDYPMVASGYSARRSALARSLGLGQQRRPAQAKSTEVSAIVAEVPKARRGRPVSGAAPKATAKARGGRKAATSVAAE